MRSLVPTLFSLLVTFTVAVASAREANPDSRGADDNSASHLSGLEVMVRPGVGAASGNSPIQYHDDANVRVPAAGVSNLIKGASPYGVGFVGLASLGYRFHPVISAGFRGGIQTISSDASLVGNDGTTNVSRSAWNAGFYVRGYPLALNERVRKRLDPWVSVGVGYLRDAQTYNGPLVVVNSAGAQTTLTADYALDHHAVAIPIGIGVDYRVLPMLSIGPSVEYTIAPAIAGCWGQSAPEVPASTYCTSSDPGREILSASTYGALSAGIDIKLTPF